MAKIIRDRIPEQAAHNGQRSSSLEMCNVHGCYEWAQSSDPTEADTRLFMCEACAAAAAARGETGVRVAPAVDQRHYNLMDPEIAAARTAEIQAALAAGVLPAERKKPGRKAKEKARANDREVPVGDELHGVPDNAAAGEADVGTSIAAEGGGDGAVLGVRAPDDGAGRLDAGGGDAGGGDGGDGASAVFGVAAPAAGDLPVDVGMSSPPVAEPKQPTKGIVMPKGKIPRRVKCVETGEVFASVQEAGASVGRHHGGFSTAIAKGRKCGGKTWAWADGEPVTPAKKTRPYIRRQLPPASAAPGVMPEAPAKVVRASAALVAADMAAMPANLLTALAAGLRGVDVQDLHLAFKTAGVQVELSVKSLTVVGGNEL